MSTRSPFRLITSKSQSTFSIESDCFMESPTISPTVETNCACSSDHIEPPTSHQFTHPHQLYQMPAFTHTATLSPDNYYAFNSYTHADLVVYNQAVQTLLDQFQQPQTIGHALHQSNQPAEAEKTLQELVNAGILQPIDAPTTPNLKPPQTLTAWLHITNDCNLRCPYCYINKTPDPMLVDKGKEAINAIFRSAVKQGFRAVKLKYAGGEATRNFGLIPILQRYALEIAGNHNLQLDGVILSNGVGITNRMIADMKRLNIRLMISLDGIGTAHDRNRPFINGSGSFQHVENSLDRLATQGLTPSISITISQRNLDGLAETVAYVLERGLPFTLNFYRENDCSAGISDLAYQEEKIISAIQSAFKVIENQPPPLQFNWHNGRFSQIRHATHPNLRRWLCLHGSRPAWQYR